ncbi:hypothetical protein [Nocardia africana]|uniref:Integrase catalytic domain-containing protein n=1 Tax=Nocardia africana TaxID=134964 RepID=A0ABW6NRR9_9NOCA
MKYRNNSSRLMSGNSRSRSNSSSANTRVATKPDLQQPIDLIGSQAKHQPGPSAARTATAHHCWSSHCRCFSRDYYRNPQWRGGKPQLTETMNAFRGSLGIRVIQCRPRDPEAKGLVERANGYLETSFLPGRVFASPADFNAQLGDWLVKANQRHHRRLECRPVDRWEADLAAMLDLPPVDPVVGWRLTTRLPRDHYVRLDSNDYSVHPGAIGRRVEVRADLDQVVVTVAGAELARHQRCWADHQTITDPDHAAAAADLRRSRRLIAVPAIDTDVEHRNLSDYDRMFDLDEAGSSEEIA